MAQETPTLDTTVVTGGPSAGPGSFYGVQGNTAMARSLHEKEQAAAVRQARIKKELMAAMAAQSMAARPQTFTTAEEYMAANKPPTPPPSDDVDNFVPRTSYVPDFEPVPEIRQTVRPPARSVEMPKQKMRLLDRLKAKKAAAQGPEFDMENPYVDSPAPAADYSEASTPPSTEEIAARDAAMMEATQSEGVVPVGNLPQKEKKGGFFSKLFKPSGNPEPDPVTPVYTDPAPPMVADTPPAPPVATTPSPPSVSPAPSQDRPASIFTRRNSTPSASGQTVSVTRDVDANIGGVLVALFSGDRVEVVEKNGSTATIRLPDQRIGTVDASALSN